MPSQFFEGLQLVQREIVEINFDSKSNLSFLLSTWITTKLKLFWMYFETSFSIDFCFSRSIKFKYLSLESLEVKSNSQYLRKGSFILKK